MEENKKSFTIMIIKKIFSLIFAFIFFITLNGIIIINVLKSAFDDGLIQQAINSGTEKKESNVYVDDIAYVSPEEIAKKNNFSLEDFQIKTETNEDLETFIENKVTEILTENNIPKEVFDYIDENEENKEILNKMAGNLVEYIYGITTEIKIDENEIKKLLNNSIDSYEKKTNKKVDRSKINNVTTSFTKEYKTFVEDNVDIEARNIINSIFHGSIYYLIFIIMIISLIILIILNIKEFKFIKIIFTPILITGLTYLLINSVLQNIDMISSITSLLDNIKKTGIITTSIGTAGLIIYFIIKYIRKNISDKNA